MGSAQSADQSDPVRLHISDGLALVTLNRPAVMNAVNAAMARRLESIVKQVEDDPAVSVAIVSGAGGRAFCAGADLKEVAAGGLPDIFRPGNGFAGFVHARREKPWIAAVTGPALAGGFEIALACDLIVASEGAEFGLPEVKRGLIASAGGLYRLPSALPKAIALELIVTGGTIGARRALELGLINRVVPAEAVSGEATRLARAICANAPLAVRESLRIARLAVNFDRPELREAGDEAQEKLSRSADYQEGSRAFLEKRMPRWQGR